VGPSYQRPAVAVPSAFRGAEAGTPSGPSAAAIADVPWWAVFRDPVLEGLVAEAVANNQDLAMAVARVEEARARVGVARAGRFPWVEGDASATRTRGSQSLGYPPFGPRIQDDFRATVTTTWELDLWGRVRRGEEAACADWLASEEGRRAVVVTLVGDVGEAYLDLRELDEELEITRRTLGTRRRTHDLFSKRLESGAASRLETAQSSADVAAVAALEPDLERRVAQQENRLSLLLGRPPSSIARGPALGAVPAPASPGLPASLLERRPDVREAEHRVEAAVARVGVAEAERLPRIDLSAMLGSQTVDLADLGTEKAGIGSLGAGLTAPLFQGGRLLANRDAAVARWEAAVAAYRKAVQDALRDVADQLVAMTKATASRAELEKAVKSLEEAHSLVTTRYEGGASTYFEVLDAQRRLLPAEIELARAKRDRLVAFVRLYRALGGGWRAGPCAIPPPAASARR
jgi:multidrug efflux system outer membrane protein